MTAIPYVPREEYDKLTAVNWSTLKHLSKTPAHYLEAITVGTDDSDALTRGRATHTACLEPEKFRSEFAVYSGRRAGKDWEAFAAAHRDRDILTESTYETVLATAKAVRGSEMARPYITGGNFEVTLKWGYESPSVPGFESYRFDCKARLDYVTRDSIADLKSTRDGSPSGFAREVLRYEYHVQAAWYVDAYKAVTGVELPYFMVTVEAKAPHVVQVYEVPPDILQLGRARYRELLDTLSVCRRESRWPGYAETPMQLAFPRWARPLDGDEDFDSDLVIGE